MLGLEAYVGPELGGQVQQQAAQALEAVEASRSVVDSARAEYVEIVRRDAEANRQAANLMERIAGLDEDWPEENEEETEDR